MRARMGVRSASGMKAALVGASMSPCVSHIPFCRAFLAQGVQDGEALRHVHDAAEG